MAYDLIAAVDLGSNSFRLQVGRVVDDQVYPLDTIKEPVRLAAGLTSNKLLDAPSQERALQALRLFGERLRGFAPDAVRAVATNTLRVAKNAAMFLPLAEEALGFPIEVIAGREEARLIYVGVAHTLPNPRRQQFVIDIGGGSTEFIIGKNFKPIELESIYMGCVGMSLKHFPEGKVTKNALKEAEMAARGQLQGIVHRYRELGWSQVVGSSGTAKALCDLVSSRGYAEGTITRDGLLEVREEVLRAGNVLAMMGPALRGDRAPVLPGGLAIMCAVFQEFGIEEMVFSDGALRLGVLYDLLGRYHHDDLREATVTQFMRRYQVDQRQAARVTETAVALLQQLRPEAADPDDHELRYLLWAARLHEIGISVAHASYHKHSAYVLAHADMPGFSRMDQSRLARIVLAHRGKLERLQALGPGSPDWALIFCLRTAVVLHRARDDAPMPHFQVSQTRDGFAIRTDGAWLAAAPLTAAALDDEKAHWASVGQDLRITAARSRARAGGAG